jgi:signal transduction histidine kinase
MKKLFAILLFHFPAFWLLTEIFDKPNSLFKKLYVITILLSVVFNPNVFAQRERIDSLNKILPSLQDSSRVDCLNELSGIYLENMPSERLENNLKIIDTAAYYAELANREAEKINYIHGMAEGLSLKSKVVFNRYSNYAEAENLAREAIFLYRKTRNKKKLNRTYYELGHALYAQSYFEKAINNFDTSYDLSKKAGDSTYVFYSVTNSAYVYLESGDYKRAFEKVLELHQLLLTSNNAPWKAWELDLISTLYLCIEDFKTALVYDRQKYQIIKPHYYGDLMGSAELFSLNHQFDSAKYYYQFIDTSNDLRALRMYLVSVGEYYFLQGKYDKALPNFLRGLSYHKQVNDRNQVMGTLVKLAKTYDSVHDYASAFKYAQEALAIAQQTGARQFIRDCYQILYSVYDYWQQTDSALSYHKKYVAIKDSITSAQVTAKLVAYNFDQKIELLNKEKEVKQVQFQKQSLLKNVLIGSIIILLLLAAIVIRNIILKRKNEKLSLEHKLQVQQLESKLESQQALLSERLRISRELHDDIGSTLSGIVLYSHLAEDQSYTQKEDEVKNSLNIIQQSANDMVNKLNDIVWSINPEHNSLKNLMEKLEEYAAEMAKVKNIKVLAKVPENLPELQLPVETLHNIYLFCKEAINNAVKYSEASCLELNARHSNRLIEFTISDNGKGFDAERVKKGNGLMNMQKRAEEVGAKLCLKSVPLQGTIISLQLFHKNAVT